VSIRVHSWLQLALSRGVKSDLIAAIDLERHSSRSARPAKDFESWETVSITEARSVPLFNARRNFLNHEWTSLHVITARQARMNTNRRCSGRCMPRHSLLRRRVSAATAHFC